MDRVDHITRLCVPTEASARSEREQLRALERRGIASEHDQSRRGIAGAELANLDRLRESTDVEDRDVGTMSAQHHTEPAVLDISSEDREIRVTLDQPA